MQAQIKKIGNEYGLILPLETLRACGFSSEATVVVMDQQLVVTPAKPRQAREGWAEAIAAIPIEAIERDFKEMADVREVPDEWDEQGWQWPEVPTDEKI